MANQRNISIEIPRGLLAQVQQRCLLNDRTRNAEFRYLLNMALDAAGDEDVKINLPKEDLTKSVARVTYEMENILLDRCAAFQRPLGWELVRLTAYAIQLRTDRDLAFIEAMMSSRGQAAVEPQPPAQPEPQLSEQA